MKKPAVVQPSPSKNVIPSASHDDPPSQLGAVARVEESRRESDEKVVEAKFVNGCS